MNKPTTINRIDCSTLWSDAVSALNMRTGRLQRLRRHVRERERECERDRERFLRAFLRKRFLFWAQPSHAKMKIDIV